MAKSSRAYRGAKRAKELKRLKKQEEKRRRRFTKENEVEGAEDKAEDVQTVTEKEE